MICQMAPAWLVWCCFRQVWVPTGVWRSQHGPMMAVDLADALAVGAACQLPAPGAAWLHDVGYAPTRRRRPGSPPDGARYLRALGAPKRLIDLMAHHSYMLLEARLRGCISEMTAFDGERSAVRDALWYCDLTTSPDSHRVSAAERLEERYGPGHVVTRFITAGTPDLLAAVNRAEQRLRLSPPPPGPE